MAGTSEIKLDPSQALSTNTALETNVTGFLQAVKNLGGDLSTLNAQTEGNPVNKLLIEVAENLTTMSGKLNTSVGSYSGALSKVVNNFNTAFMDGKGQTLKAIQVAPVKVEVDKKLVQTVKVTPENLRTTARLATKHLGEMTTSFDVMTKQIEGSGGYWTGDSANNARDTWKISMVPLKDGVAKDIEAVVKALNEQADKIAEFDRTNKMQAG